MLHVAGIAAENGFCESFVSHSDGIAKAIHEVTHCGSCSIVTKSPQLLAWGLSMTTLAINWTMLAILDKIAVVIHGHSVKGFEPVVCVGNTRREHCYYTWTLCKRDRTSRW